MLNPQKGFHSYYGFIITNKYRSTFYIGVTNNLKNRLLQHKKNILKKVLGRLKHKELILKSIMLQSLLMLFRIFALC